jgi:hypothetical protein
MAELDLGEEIRDPILAEFLTAYGPKVPATVQPKYPGDAAVLQSFGHNPANIYADLDETRKQELSDLLREAWYTKTPAGEDIELERIKSFGPEDIAAGMTGGFTAYQSLTPSAESTLNLQIGDYMDDPLKLAAESGVAFQGPEYLGKKKTPFLSAPQDAQKRLYYVPESVDYERAMKKVLRESPQYENVPTTYDWEIKREPHTERFMYRDPLDQGRYRFFYEPGLNKFDVKTEAPKLGAMLVAGTTGMITGAAVGKPIMGGMVADTLTYGSIRAHELTKARRENLLKKEVMNADGNVQIEDWSNGDIAGQIAKETALVAGASVLTPILMSAVARAFRTFGSSNPAFQPVKGLPFTIDDFVKAFDAVEQTYAMAYITSKESGEEAMRIFNSLSAPQIMSEAERLAGMQVGISRMARIGLKDVKGEQLAGGKLQRQIENIAQRGQGEAGELANAFIQGQKEVLRGAKGKTAAAAPPGETGYPTIKQVLDAAQGEEATAAGRQAILATQTVRGAEIEAGEQALKVIETEPKRLGKLLIKDAESEKILTSPIRRGIQKFRTDAYEASSKEYDAIDKEILRLAEAQAAKTEGAQVFGSYTDANLKPLAQYADEVLAGFKRGSTPETRFAEGAGKRLKELADIIAPGSTRRSFTSLKQLDADLQSVRLAKRTARKKGRWQEERDLRLLEEEYKALRQDTLIKAAGRLGDKDQGAILVQRILDNEAAYAQKIDMFEKGLIGKLLGRTVQSKKGLFGEYKLDDIRFINKLFGQHSPEEIAPLREMVFRSGNEDLRAMIANAVKGRYKQKMMESGELKGLTEAQHTTFKRQNQDNIDWWLNKTEREIFDDATTAARGITKEVKQQQSIINNLKKTPWGKTIDDDFPEPQTIFDKTWGKGKFNASKELNKIFKQAGDVGENAARGYRAKIMREMSEKTKNFSNANEIDNYLAKNKDILEIWYGKAFVPGLRNLARISRMFERIPATGAEAAERSLALKVGSDLARVYVGIFTREGRILTAITRLGLSSRQTRVIREILNPRELVDRFKATAWMRDPKNMAAVKSLLIPGVLYNDEGFLGQARSYKVSEPRIETEEKIPPVYREMGFTYESYNIGGRVKRSKLMPLRYDI